MITLGALLVGLLLLLVLLGVLAWMQRRPRRGPEQPRTVADLVRMREAASPAEPSPRTTMLPATGRADDEPDGSSMPNGAAPAEAQRSRRVASQAPLPTSRRRPRSPRWPRRCRRRRTRRSTRHGLVRRAWPSRGPSGRRSPTSRAVDPSPRLVRALPCLPHATPPAARLTAPAPARRASVADRKGSRRARAPLRAGGCPSRGGCSPATAGGRPNEPRRSAPDDRALLARRWPRRGVATDEAPPSLRRLDARRRAFCAVAPGESSRLRRADRRRAPARAR